MTLYKRGEVVLLPFPYTDQAGSKRRPALILSTDIYNNSRSDVIVAPITSNLSGRLPNDTLLVDWASAGLLKPSVVKAVLGTIEQSLIVRIMGQLSLTDLLNVERSLANALGLVVASSPPSSS
jgi:mRNA interferase MazF